MIPLIDCTNLSNFALELQIVINVLVLFGAIYLLISIIKVLLLGVKVFRLYIWSQYICCNQDYVKRYGKWALVTGATDGIGLAIARELARRGHSIILLGRNEQKLAQCKTLLEKDCLNRHHGTLTNTIEVLTVKIDLSTCSNNDYDTIEHQIDPHRRDIGILVNNAGMASELVARLHRQPKESLRDIINVNCLAAAQFTRMVLPGMLNRRRGLIVNVSSLFGHKSFVVEYANLYCATKAFSQQFTRQLRLEYAGYPIDFIDTDCGFVNGGVWAKTSKPNWTYQFMATPDMFGKSFVGCISTRYSQIHGHIWSEIQMFLFNIARILHIDRLAITILTGVSIDDCNLTPKAERKNPTKKY